MMASAATLALILIVTLGITLARSPPYERLRWEVEVGIIFQFEVTSWGNALGGIAPVPEILSLNGSIINVTVSNLPVLSGLSVVSFVDRVVEVEKVNCTFSDGSLLPSFTNTQIVAALSGSLLPNGSWFLLDSLLPDETPSWTPEAEFYASSVHADHFRMKYIWCGWVDDAGGWTGNSSLVTGVPYEVLWWYSHGPQTLYIQLTRVQAVIPFPR